MNNINDTPKPRKNKHLNEFERGGIDYMYNAIGNTIYQISKIMNRSYNTVSSEIKRGSVPHMINKFGNSCYNAKYAHNNYLANRVNSKNKFKYLVCEKFMDYVIDCFHNKKHSLDAISGYAKENNLFEKDKMLSTRTLYNYVDRGFISITSFDLPLRLKRNTKEKTVRENKRIYGKSISQRPEPVNLRSQFGHWEIDTVLGKKGKDEPVLLTMTERLTRAEIIIKLKSKTNECVTQALMKLKTDTGVHFSKIFKSMTADNGSEFSGLSKLEEGCETNIYYAHPYSAFERGSNENHNGLIRRFIPKGKSISDYSVDKISNIQNWCNTLPRKILGYKTPAEMFSFYINQILTI